MFQVVTQNDIFVDLYVDSEKIVILAENGSVLTDVPNIVALDENDKIVSIGETQENIQEKFPREWEKIKDRVHFCKIFSANEFRPQLTAIIINLMSHSATHRTTESQSRWLKDAIELHLNISEYERLTETVQQVFEYYAQETGLVKIKSLVINNQAISLGRIRLAEWSARIGIPLTLCPMVFLAIYVIKNVMGERYSAPIPKDEIGLFFVVFMIACFLFINISLFLSAAIWKFATQSLIPSVVSKTIIESQKLGLPKYLMNLLWQDPLSRSDGG